MTDLKTMNMQPKSSFLERTLRNIKKGWRSIADSEYDVAVASSRPDLPDSDLERLREHMRSCLEGKGGEVSARSRAAALGHAYLALEPAGREKFLRVLAEDFGVNHDHLEAAIGAFRRANGDAKRLDAEAELREVLEAPRLKLLRQFNDLPDGVKFLVDMRADLLPLARSDANLKALDGDLRHLLNSWFDVGFLELRRITWDTSSAALLEKLIAYEAVHAIESWDDLKNRLDSDRRCFAFFHPRMPDEPLIFVEVALVNGMSGSVQALLDENAPVIDPEKADTAIFYSISNAQRGLAGISFGNFLIKRVAGALAAEFPNLKTFATLSPIPGFVKWLGESLSEGQAGLLTTAERKALNKAAARGGGAKGTFKALLGDGSWVDDENLRQAMGEPLRRLCARYLVKEKGKGGRARDPVAHFHLSNGAAIERLNWLGDTSENGYRQAAGMMVNYLYDLSQIEANHEAYTGAGKVTASSAVKSLI